MTDHELLTRARSLLDLHGLHKWTVKLDRASRRAGACQEHTKTITLSRAILGPATASQVDEVILHEIAHALVGSKHGHDAVWRAKAKSLGIPAKSTLKDAKLPEAPWVGTCRKCGTTRHLYRTPRRVVSCGKCSKTFDKNLILTWTKNGVPTMPPGTYQTELRSLAQSGRNRFAR